MATPANVATEIVDKVGKKKGWQDADKLAACLKFIAALGGSLAAFQEWLSLQPAKVPLQIKQWACTGELKKSDLPTPAELLYTAGRILEKSCIDERFGDILFLGSDGKFYTGSVGFSYYEANPISAREMIESSETLTEKATQKLLALLPD